MNQRPLNDRFTQEAMDLIGEIMRRYDLAGAVCLINRDEWGYGYTFETTWSAATEDPLLQPRDGMSPLGFRIRAKEAELGRERAAELVTGAAFTITSLKDFGTQTQIWAQDLLKMLRNAGIDVRYTPFNGQRLPRIQGIDMRGQR